MSNLTPSKSRMTSCVMLSAAVSLVFSKHTWDHISIKSILFWWLTVVSNFSGFAYRSVWERETKQRGCLTSFCRLAARFSSSLIWSLAKDNSCSFSVFICWTKLEMHLNGELEPLVLIFSDLSDATAVDVEFLLSSFTSQTMASRVLYCSKGYLMSKFG